MKIKILLLYFSLLKLFSNFIEVKYEKNFYLTFKWGFEVLQINYAKTAEFLAKFNKINCVIKIIILTFNF